MPMDLPTPNAAEVAEFAQLYHKRFGVELTEAEDTGQCTRLIRYEVLSRYVLPAHLKEKEKHADT